MDPYQSARPLLNALFPGSFPDPLHLLFEEKKVTGEYLIMQEAAEYLRLTERQLRELIKARRISYAQIDYRNTALSGRSSTFPATSSKEHPNLSHHSLCAPPLNAVARTALLITFVTAKQRRPCQSLFWDVCSCIHPDG